MKTAVILIISATVLLISGANLTNTVWTYQILKTCVDTLTLKPDQKVVEHDCEMNYTFHGSYKLNKDTLLVILKDDSHSEDRDKASVFIDKYLLKNNTLSFLGSSTLVNGKWEYTKAKTDKGITYRKIK